MANIETYKELTNCLTIDYQLNIML